MFRLAADRSPATMSPVTMASKGFGRSNAANSLLHQRHRVAPPEKPHADVLPAFGRPNEKKPMKVHRIICQTRVYVLWRTSVPALAYRNSYFLGVLRLVDSRRPSHVPIMSGHVETIRPPGISEFSLIFCYAFLTDLFRRCQGLLTANLWSLWGQPILSDQTTRPARQLTGRLKARWQVSRRVCARRKGGAQTKSALPGAGHRPAPGKALRNGRVL